MLGKIFGSDAYRKKHLETIDALNISDAKKEEMVVDFYGEYTSFKIAQRLLGVMITVVYLIALILAMVYNHMNIDLTSFIAVATAFNVGLVMLAVVSFYFGGGTIAAIRGK